VNRTSPRLLSRVAMTSAASLSLIALTGCVSNHYEQVLEVADALRSQAQRLTERWNAAPPPPPPVSLPELRTGLVGTFDVAYVPVPTSSRPATGVAHHARAESGGGLTYRAEVVRLCVRYDLGPDNRRLQVSDDTCPDTLDRQTGLGTVEIDIDL